jgi:hypothetical protein
MQGTSSKIRRLLGRFNIRMVHPSQKECAHGEIKNKWLGPQVSRHILHPLWMRQVHIQKIGCTIKIRCNKQALCLQLYQPYWRRPPLQLQGHRTLARTMDYTDQIMKGSIKFSCIPKNLLQTWDLIWINSETQPPTYSSKAEH